jgi:hypothetical protein
VVSAFYTSPVEAEPRAGSGGCTRGSGVYREFEGRKYDYSSLIFESPSLDNKGLRSYIETVWV